MVQLNIISQNFQSFIRKCSCGIFLKNITILKSKGMGLNIGCRASFEFNVLRFKNKCCRKIGLGIKPSARIINVATNKFAGQGYLEFKMGSFKDNSLEDATVGCFILSISLQRGVALMAAAANLYRAFENMVPWVFSWWPGTMVRNSD